MDEDRPAHALYYDDDLVANLQLRWGAGFMSPGGRAELTHMIRGSTFPVARVSISAAALEATIACS
jgi:hypothetical protein